VTGTNYVVLWYAFPLTRNSVCAYILQAREVETCEAGVVSMTFSAEEWDKFLGIAADHCREQGAVSVERCSEHDLCLIVLMPDNIEEKHLRFVLEQRQ
jgi:hypothetical protein